MITCGFCSKRAVAHSPYLHAYLCKDHFISYYEERVKLTIKKFNLIKPGDRVAVAVSGGKDSLTMLYLLTKFSGNMKYELFAITIDEGIKGYSDVRVMNLKKNAGKMGIELYVTSFKEEIGMSLDEATEVLKKKGFEYKPCTVCGVFRRYLMNKTARELGATKLATGHNLDDEAQVFLMNALRGALPNIIREGLITEYALHEKMVPRIKPLYFIPEKETLIYSKLIGLDVFLEAECPYVIYSMRHPLRHWLNKLEWKTPYTKYKVIATKELILSLLRDKRGREHIGTCKVCGEPSSTYICKTCFYKGYLGIKI